MPFNNVIDRTDAGSLIPQEVANEILKNVAEKNPLMRMARRLQNMSRKQRRMPVMTALATAYFVSGDNSKKETTEVAWGDKYIEAEELAVIVPIPEAVLDDSEYDIWAEVKPELETAFDIAIYQAVVNGTNIPQSWTTNLGAAGLKAGATAAGHVISIADYADLFQAILGEKDDGTPGLIGLLEQDGYMSTGHIAHTDMRRKLRNVREPVYNGTDVEYTGAPIFLPSMQNRGSYDLDGSPCEFPMDGSVAAADLLLTGQWNQLVYAMRQDITYKILTEAVIQDGAGNIVYNLAQQDMVALRAVMRLGFALPNPINRKNQNSATRFPFAFLGE